MNQNTLTQQSHTSIHYAWWVVLGGFTTQLIMMICLQGLPLTLSQIEKTLNIPHSSAGMILATFGACYTVFSLFWGYMADRFGPRKAISLAGVVVGIALFLFGTYTVTLTQAIIFYAFVGFGAAGLYSATIPKLVGAWFSPQKRGRAMSLVTPGGTICGMILGLLLPYLSINYGWQHSFVILSLIVFALTSFMYLIIRNNPAEKGLLPYGSSDSAQISTPPRQKASLKDFVVLIKQKVTWQLMAMFICWKGPYTIGTFFTALSLVTGGLSVTQSGIGIMVYKLCAFCGQQIWGPLSDRFERKTIITIGSLGWALAAIFYALVWGKGMSVMCIAVGLLGFNVGIVPVILAAFSDYFEPQLRGTANGLISTTAFIGGFFGPLVAGFLADIYGMSATFIFAAAIMLCTSMIAYTLPKLRTKSV